MCFHVATSISVLCGSIWKQRVHEDKASVRTHTFCETLCSPTPLRETPAESVTHHEACSIREDGQISRTHDHSVSLCVLLQCSLHMHASLSSTTVHPLQGSVMYPRSGSSRRCWDAATAKLWTHLRAVQKIILHALQATATHLPFCQPKLVHFLHSSLF